jgi:hypothetical protein
MNIGFDGAAIFFAASIEDAHATGAGVNLTVLADRELLRHHFPSACEKPPGRIMPSQHTVAATETPIVFNILVARMVHSSLILHPEVRSARGHSG